MSTQQSSGIAYPCSSKHFRTRSDSAANSLSAIGLAILAQATALLLLLIVAIKDPLGRGGAFALLSCGGLLVHMAFALRRFSAVHIVKPVPAQPPAPRAPGGSGRGRKTALDRTEKRDEDGAPQPGRLSF